FLRSFVSKCSPALTLSLRPSPTSSLTRLSNSDQPPAHHHTILSSLTIQASFTTQPPLSLAISLSHGQNWGSLSRSPLNLVSMSEIVGAGIVYY
ncbi:hypothetical protein DVH24_031489, partial [Malus domestica]